MLTLDSVRIYTLDPEYLELKDCRKSGGLAAYDNLIADYSF